MLLLFKNIVEHVLHPSSLLPINILHICSRQGWEK